MLIGPSQISSFSEASAGPALLRMSVGNVGGTASAAWAASSMIQIMPLYLDYPFMVRYVFALNGATVGTDSWAVAVYSEDGANRLVTSASTLQAGTVNRVQVVAVTADTLLAPGRYLMAMGCSGVTATFFQAANQVTKAGASEIFEHLSGYSSGMPASVTPAIPTLFNEYVFGISQGSVI